MFVIKASTPEAMRDEIVKWLNDQASIHSIAARIASRKGTQHTELAKSQAYGDAAKFLKNCTVEVPKIDILFGPEPNPDNNGV